jgi:hypothetical protein
LHSCAPIAAELNDSAASAAIVLPKMDRMVIAAEDST